MTIFSDHSELATLTQVVNQNAGKPLASRYGMSQQFWATPQRPATSPIVETLEVSLATPQLVNLIQFDLARYPQSMWLEYQDPSTSEWVPLLDNTGSPINLAVHKSVPHIIPPPSAMVGVKHPQHAFMGHWESLQIGTKPTVLQRLRLKLQRMNSDASPVDTYGKRVDYSLAVRLLSFGYRVASAQDVPRALPTDTGGYFQSFAATNDAVSSTVNMGLRQLDAALILGEGESDLVWRCEPQPDPNCVVSVYADVRTPDGDAQVIDRIFLDPVNNGAHITAYFASGDQSGDFVSPSNPIKTGDVDATSGVSVDTAGIHFLASDSLIISNTQFQYDVSRPWWVGMVINPSFGVATAPGPTNVVFDCGAWSLVLTDAGISLELITGDFMDVAYSYQANVPITVVVSYDGANISLLAQGDADTASSTIIASLPLPAGLVEQIAIGSDLTRTSFGLADLFQLVIKEEQPTDPALYQANPRQYAAVSAFSAEDPATSQYNALLRFDPLSPLMSNAYSWGLFGGYPSRYESMEWTPITRDFVMQRGWMDLPPVKAKFWKLEFTHLQATYADVYEPTTVVTKRFPSTVLDEWRRRIESTSSTMDDAGLAQQTNLSTYSAYDDAPSVVSTGGTGLGYTNTEVYAARDNSTAERLYQRSGEAWSYVPWQTHQSAPRFQRKRRHVYTEEVVTRTTKVAYMVGLRRLNFARQSFATQYDLSQFEEMFYDVDNFASISWIFDEDLQGITSGGSDLVSATSKTFVTNRDVRGLQFAAQQSPARRLLEDSEFDDPLHTDWTASGDAVIGDLVDSTAFGTLLPVSRTARSGTWEDVVGNFPTWGDFAAATPPATYGSLSAKLGKTPSGADGVQSVSVTQPKGGYLYAAARVVADEDLSLPLWLQIYDTVTNRVLAEEPYTVRKGQICEWWATYRIGTGLITTGNVTWGDLSGTGVTAALQSFFDDFNRADATSLGRLVSGQEWITDPEMLTEPGQEQLHLVSNKAAVTSAYPNQSAAVDVQTPWGSLEVVLGAYSPLSHLNAARVPMIKLGGYWFMNDNSIVDDLTGREVFFSSAITTGDTLRFDFKPTSLLTPTENPSSVPPELFSWAIAVYRNNTFVASVISARALTTIRSLTGPSGVTYDSVQWTPRRDIAVLPKLAYQSLPRQFENTTVVVDPVTGGQTWTSDSGEVWQLPPTSTYTHSFQTASLAERDQFTAASGQDFAIQLTSPSVEGILSGTINAQLSGSVTTTWFTHLLDDLGTSQLHIRADGALVRTDIGLGDTVLKTDVWGVGTVLNNHYQIIMTSRSKLPASVISAFSIPSGDAQVIVFVVGGTIISVYSGNNVFSGHTRAVMANNGSWVGNVAWMPVLGPVNATVGGVYTWGNVDGNDTKTWGDLQHVLDQVITNPVEVRLVQKTTSLDAWFVDALDLFFDPIVWESTNDGDEWIAMAEIRNNPDAAVLFSPKKTTGAANKLAYRVTAFAPNAWVSNVALRPWYQGFMRYAPTKPPQPHGPNLNPLDHYADVPDDPHWMVWHEPIPREWFFVYRQLLPNIVPPKNKPPMITERISLHG